MTHVLRSLAALGIVAILSAPLARPAVAQIDPSDSGAGLRVGVQSLNQSGQVGDVTLFDSGAETRLVVHLEGTHGRKELARIARGKSCDTYDLTQGYSLAPLATNGVSKTLVHAPSAKLLSGNYLVVVMSSGTHGNAVACGYLYQ